MTNFLKKAGIYMGITALILSSCELTEDLPGVNETVLELEGVWNVIEDIQNIKSTGSALDAFTVTISADPDNVNGIIMDDFAALGIAIKGTVSGTSINIPEQTVDGFTVDGSGTISNNNNKIDMEYDIDDSGSPVSYIAVFTKN